MDAASNDQTGSGSRQEKYWNMCGIAGFVSKDGGCGAASAQIVRRMTDRMRYRGPDAEGIWTGEHVVLGHRRLAILDLDARANQPMVAADGRYVMVFNGEIYNFRDLRRELETEGLSFHTTSDSEIILALFARHGEHMLEKLRGMFAIALWDVQSQELFLARDPYGIKPLYYAAVEGGVIFASQVKGLLASEIVPEALEPAGVAGFYIWGCVPEPWTLYRGVFALPAGHWLRVRSGVAKQPVCWTDIRQNWATEPLKVPLAEVQERVREAVKSSVRAHLVSDVPVSVFLSGGIDSGTIAGLTSELGAQVEGITIAFDEFESLAEDEVPAAAAIAAHYGLPHHVRRISREEFEHDTPLILDAMDQPSIDGVNSWFASKATAERGYKVVVSGTGGDEIFHGYPQHRQVPRDAKWGRAIVAIPGVRSLLKAPCSYLAAKRAHPKFKGLPEFMGTLEGAYFLKRCLFLPQELPALMGEEQARIGLGRLGGSPPGIFKVAAFDGAAAACQMDSSLYLRNQLLRDCDWASMRHSLELRTPLVDAVLLQELAPLLPYFANGAGKKMLSRSPTSQLPEAIINRPKTGFNLPMAKWLTEANAQSGISIPHSRGTPWARLWAQAVIATMPGMH